MKEGRKKLSNLKFSNLMGNKRRKLDSGRKEEAMKKWCQDEVDKEGTSKLKLGRKSKQRRQKFQNLRNQEPKRARNLDYKI